MAGECVESHSESQEPDVSTDKCLLFQVFLHLIPDHHPEIIPGLRQSAACSGPARVQPVCCPYLSQHRGQNGELRAVLPGAPGPPGPSTTIPNILTQVVSVKYRTDIGPVLSHDRWEQSYVTSPVH